MGLFRISWLFHHFPPCIDSHWWKLLVVWEERWEVRKIILGLDFLDSSPFIRRSLLPSLQNFRLCTSQPTLQISPLVLLALAGSSFLDSFSIDLWCTQYPVSIRASHPDTSISLIPQGGNCLGNDLKETKRWEEFFQYSLINRDRDVNTVLCSV